MRNRSYIIKVLLLFFAAVGAFLVFIFFVFFRNITSDGIAAQAAYMRHYAELMSDAIAAAARTDGPEAVRSFAAEKAGLLGARVTCVAADGAVVADTEENPAYMENHSGRPEIRRALAGEGNYVVRYSATLRKDMLYYAHPVRDSGRVVGVLRLSLPMAALERLLGGLKLQYLLAVVFPVAAATAAILVIYGYFKREIARFSRISRRVADGDFAVGFSGTGSFEIRELSKSFETMVRKIRGLVSEVVSEKNEIESIVSSVSEGIAVIDGRGVVTRANRAFETMFDFSGVRGRFHWEIVRNNEINAMVKHGPREGERAAAVEVGAKTLLVSLARLPDGNETVLVCSDVTQVKHWETMKKDLVANVTHELGTPLTAVKGYVETLIGEERDERKLKYLRIVARHAERLANIVQDLLALSKLESGAEGAPAETVRLGDVLENVLPLFRERAAAKGLAFAAEVPEDLPSITGDPFALEQAFTNLLDNAVKYTEKGGVTVAAFREGNRLIMEIRDTGIGIPEQDRDRIFERFYVVDKSRSRAQGGTGLGLSIVKHIVARHGGEIGVKSVLGHGTTFTLFFPTSLH